MDSLVVTVHSSSPRGTLMLELPGEVQLRILLPKLIRVLGLPSADDGGSYQLIHQTGRRVVHEAETLLGAGVVTGDELLVVSAAAQAQSAQEEITSSPGAGPAPGEGAPTDPVVMGQAAAADSPPDPTHQSSPGFQREGTRECESLNPAHDRTRGRTVAFWSGPAGGTGRTMLALALAAHAAERGADTGLLALSEPGLSAYLHLPRVPNAATFFDTGNLSAAGQAVSWESEAGEAALQVVLGPARPWEGGVERRRIGGLVEAAEAAHPLVVIDLPPLTPGENAWSLKPLALATDVVLVAVPTAAGVAAIVEALAVLRDLRSIAPVHLALNQRAPGGLSAPAFTTAVSALWGSCPQAAAEVPFLPDLDKSLDQGELPEGEGLSRAVESLAELTAGLH